MRPMPNDESRIKLFTVAEANALLPTIVPLLLDLREAKSRLEQAQHELAQLTTAMRSNGSALIAFKLEREIAELLHRISAGIDGITSQGIEIKDIDQGLIDFPALRAGRVVFLCWRLGEDQIAYWHDLHTGFAGREPL